MSTRCIPVPPQVSEIHVRVAREDEFTEVGALTLAGYDADGYLMTADGTYNQHYADWLADAAPRGRDSVLLVAASDTLLGTVTWCPPGSSAREMATTDRQGEFRTLSVAPDARRRGIARALVANCLDRASAAGLTEVLICSLSVMKPAHQLYGSLGFERRSELDWSPVDGLVLWAFSLDMSRHAAVVN